TKALLVAQLTTLKEAQANLQAAEERHRVGLATIADVLQAKTALSRAQLTLETTQGALQTTRGALALSRGLPANVPYDVALPPDLRQQLHGEHRDSDSAVLGVVADLWGEGSRRRRASGRAARARDGAAGDLPGIRCLLRASHRHAAGAHQRRPARERDAVGRRGPRPLQGRGREPARPPDGAGGALRRPGAGHPGALLLVHGAGAARARCRHSRPRRKEPAARPTRLLEDQPLGEDHGRSHDRRAAPRARLLAQGG